MTAQGNDQKRDDIDGGCSITHYNTLIIKQTLTHGHRIKATVHK